MLGSCEKILEKEPTDRISISDLFKDVQGSKTALAGAYHDLLSEDHYMKNLMVYPDLLGGNIKYSKAKNNRLEDIYNASQTAIISSMNDTYSSLYAELNNVNNIIFYTPLSTGSDLDKLKIIAEAKCLRALIHFDLLRTFARPFSYSPDGSHVGIVINLKPQLYGDAPPVRSTVTQAYEAIINDLSDAIKVFDNNNSGILSGGYTQNYFTSASAQALLAKVYLYSNNWDKAFSLSDQLIKSNRYTLITNANYVSSWAGRIPSSESIFEIAIETAFSSTGLGGYYDINNPTYRQYAATGDITGLYTASDVRKSAAMFNSVAINGITYFFTKKYSAGSIGQTSIKLLRLSELYLIRAEAAVEKSAPDFSISNSDLTLIRKRGDPSVATSNILVKADLIDAILLERRKELAFEGNLLFDLVRRRKNVERSDCNSTACNLNENDFRLVMPLPSNTIIANSSIVQNQGY